MVGPRIHKPLAVALGALWEYVVVGYFRVAGEHAMQIEATGSRHSFVDRRAMLCLKSIMLPVWQPSIILLYLLLAVSAAYGIDPSSDWQLRMEREINKMREEAARLHKEGDKLWKKNNRRGEEIGRSVEEKNKQAQTSDRPKKEDSRPTVPDNNTHESLAQQHNAESHNAGGLDVSHDDANTILYLTKASEHGDAHAQCVLGTMYVLGQGVPKDEAKAAQLFEESATQKNADAQYALGWMYANGRGVSRDEVKAVQWCLKAAAQGTGTRASCQNLRRATKRMSR